MKMNRTSSGARQAKGSLSAGERNGKMSPRFFLFPFYGTRSLHGFPLESLDGEGRPQFHCIQSTKSLDCRRLARKAQRFRSNRLPRIGRWRQKLFTMLLPTTHKNE